MKSSWENFHHPLGLGQEGGWNLEFMYYTPPISHLQCTLIQRNEARYLCGPSICACIRNKSINGSDYFRLQTITFFWKNFVWAVAYVWAAAYVIAGYSSAIK